jgi:hypothetical protein
LGNPLNAGPALLVDVEISLSFSNKSFVAGKKNSCNERLISTSTSSWSSTLANSKTNLARDLRDHQVGEGIDKHQLSFVGVAHTFIQYKRRVNGPNGYTLDRRKPISSPHLSFSLPTPQRMSKSSTQLRASAFLRRGRWQLRQGHCGLSAVALLLLFGLALLSLMLWVGHPRVSALTSGLSNLRPKPQQAGGETNALRWGAGDSTVILKGQTLQRLLPLQYPNGASNQFQCDLPSLRFQCDLDADEGCRAYPQLFPSAALFDNWKPEDTAQVPHAIFDSICHFNVSDPVSGKEVGSVE